MVDNTFWMCASALHLSSSCCPSFSGPHQPRRWRGDARRVPLSEARMHVLYPRSRRMGLWLRWRPSTRLTARSRHQADLCRVHNLCPLAQTSSDGLSHAPHMLSLLAGSGLYDCCWSEENENILISASGDGSVKVSTAQRDERFLDTNRARSSHQSAHTVLKLPRNPCHGSEDGRRRRFGICPRRHRQTR